MKKILVPVDFSECSQYAIEFAASIADKASAELYLVHIVESPSAGVDFSSGEWGKKDNSPVAEPHYMIGLMKYIHKKMDQIKKLPYMKNIKVHDSVQVGAVAPFTIKAAEKYATDMIIMGTHGASGLNEVFVGSNSEKVVRLANQPVFTIKERIKKEPRKVVFATDFSEETEQVFPHIKSFAELFGASIHILKVNTIEGFETNRESRVKVNKFLSKQDQKYEVTIYNDLVKEAGILHYAKDVNADVIALGTHGRKGLSRMFNGSVAEDMVNHSFCPVFTVNICKK